jgi:hypothetical protein
MACENLKACHEHCVAFHHQNNQTIEDSFETQLSESEPHIDIFPPAKRIKLDESLASMDTLPNQVAGIYGSGYYYIQQFEGLKMKLKRML